MIKGCNKRVVVMNETGNDVIEQAFFIIKPDKIKDGVSDNDIIKQANSILERCTYGERFSQMSMNVLRQEKKKKTGAFFLGTISGAVVSAAILLAI